MGDNARRLTACTCDDAATFNDVGKAMAIASTTGLISDICNRFGRQANLLWPAPGKR